MYDRICCLCSERFMSEWSADTQACVTCSEGAEARAEQWDQVVNDDGYCRGTNKNGQKCANKVKGVYFCPRHANQTPFGKRY